MNTVAIVLVVLVLLVPRREVGMSDFFVLYLDHSHNNYVLRTVVRSTCTRKSEYDELFSLFRTSEGIPMIFYQQRW
jgi:hypothetical protein